MVEGRKRSITERTYGRMAGLVSRTGDSPLSAKRSYDLRISEINSCSLVGAMDSCFSSPFPMRLSLKACSQAGERARMGMNPSSFVLL